MRFNERILWIVTVAVFGGVCLGFVLAGPATAKDDALSVRRLQITDQAGRPRIICTTDSEGTAKLTFVGPDEATSVIEQFSDGNMRLEFSGVRRHKPSIVLMSDLLRGGPALMMEGNGKEQVIMLGFVNAEGSKPGDPSKVWGLLFPAQKPYQNLAAIGVTESVNSDERRGFVLPNK